MTDGQSESCDANGPWRRKFHIIYESWGGIAEMSTTDNDLAAIDWTTLIPLIIEAISSCMPKNASVDDIKAAAIYQPLRANMAVRCALREQGFQGAELGRKSRAVIDHLQGCKEYQILELMEGD